jgi:hypothetical protein
MLALTKEGKPIGSSIDEKDAEVGSNEEIHIDLQEEKRLIRKLDLTVSPMMVLVFPVAYLRRSNIGTNSWLGTYRNTNDPRQCNNSRNK